MSLCSTHLALDPCDATGAGLRVTEHSTVAAAVLPGHPDGSQFVFLLHINLLYPWGAQQCPSLFGGQRLQEEVLVHLCVVQIDVVVGDVLGRERVGLFRLHRAIVSQLKTRNPRRSKRQRSMTRCKQRPLKTRFFSYSWHVWCWCLFSVAHEIFCVHKPYFEFDGVEFLLLQVISEHVPVDPLLLPGKFAQGVLPDPAVPVGHAQRAASLTGHAGETLPPAEVVHRHILKMHPPCPQALLSLQYWVRCQGKMGITASTSPFNMSSLFCTASDKSLIQRGKKLRPQCKALSQDGTVDFF